MLKKLINPTVEDFLQLAIHQELHASNLYKHLSNQCQRIGLFGAAKYFAGESAEELEHYQSIAEYLNDRGSVAELPELPAIEVKVTGLESALTIAYNAEVALGDKYVKWYQSADPMTQQFLLGFLEIQRKSIGEYADWLSRLALASDDKCAMLLIDQELGA